MTEPQRPSPDALLAALQSDAARGTRGQLKVFLGMCPGVGKTYAMLEAAQRELKAGRDMVVGYVETHGRARTAEQVRNLEVIPRRKIEYRGQTPPFPFESHTFEAACSANPLAVAAISRRRSSPPSRATSPVSSVSRPGNTRTFSYSPRRAAGTSVPRECVA